MVKRYVLWQCNGCGSRGRSQEGYWIRCSGDKCDSKIFKILEILEVDNYNAKEHEACYPSI